MQGKTLSALLCNKATDNQKASNKGKATDIRNAVNKGKVTDNRNASNKGKVTDNRNASNKGKVTDIRNASNRENAAAIRKVSNIWKDIRKDLIMRRVSVFAAFLTICIMFCSIRAFSGAWQLDIVGWWWLDDDGSYPKNEWRTIDGKRYYFLSTGYMASEQWVEGQYYVGADGAMLVNAVTPDGSRVDENGKRVEEDGGLAGANENADINNVNDNGTSDNADESGADVNNGNENGAVVNNADGNGVNDNAVNGNNINDSDIRENDINNSDNNGNDINNGDINENDNNVAAAGAMDAAGTDQGSALTSGGSGDTGGSEAGNVFQINSVEDFGHFARNCRRNVWSNGMTVILTQDLDFGEIGNPESIAYFNGTFLGNSHRIDNYHGATPLFQTIGVNGRVSELSLSADIQSERDNTAAFVSVNNGVLEKITVDGNVNGKVTAGILAAVNSGTGSILSCEVSGTLKGDSSSGGIAGKNQGLISSCVNRANINISVDDSNISGDDIKDILQNILLTKSINNTENLRLGIDSGGIAGYNQNGGSILDCRNEGIVGYPHHGYNSGGISGRNGGAIERCENLGTVYGRSGTGGIAGKQQPEITLDFSEDVLSSMARELDDINLLVTDTLNTSDEISNSTYDRLSALSRSMTEVKDSTNVVYNASLERFDEAADSINNTTDVLLGATGDIAGSTEDLSRSLDSLSRMTDNIDSSIDYLEEAFAMTQQERSGLLSRNAQLKSDLNTTLAFVEEIRENRLPSAPAARRARISQGLTEINRLAGDLRAMRTILSGMRDMRDRIADGSLQVEEHRRDLALHSSVSEILDALDELDWALVSLSDFSSSLGASLSNVSDGVNVNVQQNEAVRAAGNDIYAGLDSISTQLDSMNAGAREDSLEVIRNLDEINRKFSGMMDLMENERNRINSIADDGGVINDQSDAGGMSSSRIVSCRNTAEVYGDMQVGGIAGTIGVEYDLDADRDIARSGSRSLDYSFGVSASVIDSVNAGNIEARGNHAGGILGKADMGYIGRNTNEGDVRSENGYFIGGIAGYSEAALEGNAARCLVSGIKNAGGICGYGKALRNNTAVVTIEGTEEYAGAIAGDVSSLQPSEIRNNIYYSGNYGAVDNIDYVGMAERAAEPMNTVLVKFKLNGRLVGTEEAEAGTLLKDVPFPEIEEREGFVIHWDMDREAVLTEDSVVNAAYVFPVQSLASKEKLEGTEKALLMVDGRFRPEDELSFRMEGAGRYFVSVPEDGLDRRQVRVLKTFSRKGRLLVNGEEVPTETFGEYLLFDTGERELEIVLEEVKQPYRLIMLAAGAAIAALLAIALFVKLLKRAKRTKHEVGEAVEM